MCKDARMYQKELIRQSSAILADKLAELERPKAFSCGRWLRHPEGEIFGGTQRDRGPGGKKWMKKT